LANTDAPVLPQGQEPPYNPEAEQAVLAAMILDKDVLVDALARLRVEDFARVAHRNIFESIKELSDKHSPVDQITLADRLEARDQLQAVGGISYLVALANNSIAIYNWEHHLEIVRRYSLMRALIGAAHEIESLAFSPLDDTEEIVEKAEGHLLKVTEKRVESDFVRINELSRLAMEAIDEQAHSQTRILGVPSGFVDLDKELAGFRAGDLIILAARPGVGKSTLAMNFAVNSAKKGVTVAFFSLEMPSEQITQRIISAEASVNHWRMRTGDLSTDDWTKIIGACGELNDCELYIDDNPSLNLMQLRAKARRQMRDVEKDKGFIVIDYLQLMQTSRGRYEGQRAIEIGELTRGLKILAKELGVPIMVLSQLNRSIEGRDDKTPQLSDLKESGSIEQDADVVLFIDRPMSSKELESETAASAQGTPVNNATLYIGKNRNGATGRVKLIFDGPFVRFRNMVVVDEPAPAIYSDAPF